jgi:transposase InsO family protein
MGKPMSSDRPFQKLYLDILGPYPRSKSGNTGLLIVVDHNTKFHFLQPLKKFTSSKICEFLENVFYTFGVPETVLTDNGSQFKSGYFKAFLTQFGVSQICTAIYSPQANASERLNRSVLAAIRAYIGKEHINWDMNLNEINASIRANIHRSTGYSPYYLCFGQNMMLNGQDYELLRKLNMLSDDTTLKRPDVMQLARAKAKVNIDHTHDINARRYNLRSRSLRLKVGDVVYARNFAQSSAAKNFSSKLAPVFVKASVVKQLSPAYYELQNEAGKKLGVYHLKDIKV